MKNQIKQSTSHLFIPPRSTSQHTQPDVKQTIEYDAWDEMPEQIPGIDLRRALDRIGGKTGLLKKILLSFLEQYSKSDQQIREMLAQGKTEQAKQLVHTIKGIVGNIGAETLYVATQELEQRILLDPGSESAPEMERFDRNYRLVIEALAGLDLNQANEAAPTDGSDGTMDVDAISALLSEVENLLIKSDSRVRHLLPNLRTLVKGTQLITELDRLDRAVYRLDSDSALKCVSNMIAIVQIPPKQDKESFHVSEG